MKKKVSVLKKDADKVFSIFIRTRDSDGNGYLECITCGKYVHWKSADAGHFVSRRVNSLRFNEMNVNGQCKGCNYNQGEQYAYSKALDKKYGAGTAESLHNRRFESHRFAVAELEELIKHYKERNAG